MVVGGGGGAATSAIYSEKRVLLYICAKFHWTSLNEGEGRATCSNFG